MVIFASRICEDFTLCLLQAHPDGDETTLLGGSVAPPERDLAVTQLNVGTSTHIRLLKYADGETFQNLDLADILLPVARALLLDGEEAHVTLAEPDTPRLAEGRTARLNADASRNRQPVGRLVGRTDVGLTETLHYESEGRNPHFLARPADLSVLVDLVGVCGIANRVVVLDVPHDLTTLCESAGRERENGDDNSDDDDTNCGEHFVPFWETRHNCHLIVL